MLRKRSTMRGSAAPAGCARRVFRLHNNPVGSGLVRVVRKSARKRETAAVAAMALLPCLARLSLRSAPVGMRGDDDDGSDQEVTFSKEMTAKEVAANKYEQAKQDGRVVDLRSDDESSPHPRKLAKTEVKADANGKAPAQPKQPRTDFLAEYVNARRLAARHAFDASALFNGDDVDTAIRTLDRARIAADKAKQLQVELERARGGPSSSTDAAQRQPPPLSSYWNSALLQHLENAQAKGELFSRSRP